ncbi:MAG: transglycosylase domain-containing protein [Marmoricola sp.]
MSPHPRPRTDTIITHLGVMASVAAVVGLLLGCVAIPAVWTLSFATHSVEKSLENIPTDISGQALAQTTRVVDASGNVIAMFYDQNRVDVPLSKISSVMRRAMLDSEDARFYEHGALDLMGTLRALIRNSASNSTQGGSTITQQLAKMTAVDNATTQAERNAALADTYQRKFQELRRAISYEEHYSKNWILNRYLNIAYFGAGAYGIEAAAERYFSIPASQINVAQASLLAGLVQNPTRYDPTQYPARAKARRAQVLGRMVSTGTITQAEADRINASGLGLKPKATSNGCVSSVASFYCDYVRRFLLADPALGDSVADRVQLLNNGGLTIRTTLRLKFQKAANAAAHHAVAPTDHAIGALAMVQPGTGDVLAIAQSRPMGRNAKRGQTFLNYSVNPQYGDAAGFQPGSTFKLFTLTAALTQGLPATTGFYSPPQVNIPQNQFNTCDGPYPATSPWSPRNSTTNGFKTMYTGMQQSVNTYFAQLERQTGLCQPVKLAQAMGVQFASTSGAEVPSFTLGVYDVNPLEMASAYATMAARGKYCAPRPVSAILNNKGGVFKSYPVQCKQVVNPGVADRVNDILSGVMSPSGFGAALLLDKPAAGKTGTTDSNQSVWFDGYTPTVATSAVVAGVNSQGHPTSLNGVLLNGVNHGVAHGSTVAGPMWAEAMRAIQDLIPMATFVAPPNPPSQSGLPSVEGQSVAAATSALEAAGFAVAQAGQVNSNWPTGSVAKLSLGVDGHTVYLYTASGTSLLFTPPPQRQFTFTAPRPTKPTAGKTTAPPTGGKPGGGKKHH